MITGPALPPGEVRRGAAARRLRKATLTNKPNAASASARLRPERARVPSIAGAKAKSGYSRLLRQQPRLDRNETAEGYQVRTRAALYAQLLDMAGLSYKNTAAESHPQRTLTSHRLSPSRDLTAVPHNSVGMDRIFMTAGHPWSLRLLFCVRTVVIYLFNWP